MQDSLINEGIELVDTPEAADVIGVHIQIPQGWEKRFADKPIVEHCHGLYWEEFEWPKWAHEANVQVLDAIKTADRSTVPTEWVRRAVTRHTGRRPVLIPHGVDAENWRSDAECGGYVYWDKTRPDPVCDPVHLDTLAKMLPDVNFLSTFGTAEANVRVTGKVDFAEAKETMEGAAVYLVTARETFGISILQAFAAGVPVVGWRWGGAREIVEEGVTGFLARPYDWEALAECTRKALAEGPAMRDNLVAAANRYSWSGPAKAYADLYREVWIARHAEPRTTIIVTAYKLDQYLEACLDSVRAQVDPDWECIVVDDNSPDRCGEIADTYAKADPRFRVIHNPENLYLAGARNAGLEAARGRYAMALDADDMVPPHAIKILADSLDAERKTHVAYGSVYFVAEDGQTPEIYGQKWGPGHSGWPVDFSWEMQLRGDVVDADGVRHHAPNCLPYASMFRTEAARDMGGWRERCRTAEDADFWARLSSYGYRPRRVTDADTLVYRVRTDSMSQTNPRVDHSLWFGWRRANLQLAPAGVDAGIRPRVPSLEPPGISVVIPVGPGHEHLAQQAVDSLEAQTWRGWECVLVNDTGHELPPIFPSWVVHVDTGGPRGVAHARNAGARAGSSRLLFWLDADDFLQPEGLETLWRTFAEQAEFETVYYSDHFEADTPDEWKVYEAPDWEPGRLLTNGMIGAVSMLVPRVVHNRIGGFDETVSGWEDWNYQIALAAAGVCSRRINLPLWNYRKHTGRRREENLAEFEGTKADTIKRWPQFWTEGGDLKMGAKEVIDMACSSCRKSRGSTVNGAASPAAQQQVSMEAALSSGLVPLIYNGPRDAMHSYKSQGTGKTYRFANGKWAYVHPDDVDWLLSFAGFSHFTPAAEPEPQRPTTPVLS